MRVLEVSRHTNKLRPGHLHGNRFRILIREHDPSAGTSLSKILEQLRLQGLPNFYGAQRFGRQQETLQTGMALLRGEKPARPLRSPFVRKLALSAVQSALFNHYLGGRLADGLLRQVLSGDVMAKYPFGGMFVAEDMLREQERFDRREIVSAGPIFGRKTFPAKDEAARREAAVLAAAGFTPQSFAGFGKLLQGTRRHNLVYLDDLRAEIGSEGVRLLFSLPAGSYATVLLREVMKNDVEEEVR
jgi:tRNA pseudouridine13 synthase